MKKAALLLIVFIYGNIAWSQSIDPPDIRQYDPQDIERLLSGTWSVRRFTVPGEKELRFPDFDSKDYGVNNGDSYFDISSDGTCEWWDGSGPHPWRILPPYEVQQSVTLEIGTGTWARTREVLIVDHETLICWLIDKYDPEYPVAIYEIWRKEGWMIW